MNGNVTATSGSAGLLEPLCHRLPETGRLLGGVSRRTVHDLIAANELEITLVGQTRMVTHESIVAYVERQKEKAKARAGL